MATFNILDNLKECAPLIAIIISLLTLLIAVYNATISKRSYKVNRQQLQSKISNSYFRTNSLGMLVERTNKEVIIRLPVTVDTEDLQGFLNYARYKELTSGFQVNLKTVDKLAEQVNCSWWSKNRKRLIK